MLALRSPSCLGRGPVSRRSTPPVDPHKAQHRSLRRFRPASAAAAAARDQAGLPEWLPWSREQPPPGTVCPDGQGGCTFNEYMTVRDYELDGSQAVNAAVYASYLQHARHQFLASLSASHDAAQEQSPAWAMARLKLTYHLPLWSGDHFLVSIRVARATAARFVTEERVMRLPRRAGEAQQVVASAEAVVVSLDQAYRPRRISPELLEAVRTGRPVGSSGGA